MGTWGTGIYSNDIASDIRTLCGEIFPFVSIEEGNRIIFEEYAEVIESDFIDNEYASFWYALADWQWKHGILTEDIRNKAIALLKAYTGIEEWEESGQAKDVKKRIEVMDALKSQLESEMPPKKLPTKRLKKPQHRVGDVIVFKTFNSDDERWEYCWRVIKMNLPYFYKDITLTQGSCSLVPPFDAHNKYMAVLCVGTTKEPYSPHIPDLYNEYSVYAYYDYISSELPTLEALKKHGFLPTCTEEWEKSNPRMSILEMNNLPIKYLGWTYTFYLNSPIRISKYSLLDDIVKFSCLEESDRFHMLISKKNYSNIDEWHSELESAFLPFWEEKLRLERIGKQIDNLLSDDIVNPELLSPHEAFELRKKMLRESD